MIELISDNLEAKIQPKHYLDVAKRLCDDKENQKQKRFRCFDLIYLGTILQQGFKFGANRDFDVRFCRIMISYSHLKNILTTLRSQKGFLEQK